MFPIRKRIFHLHLGGNIIRTTADHPLYVEGKGWLSAADMPAAKSEGEQTAISNLGEPAMPPYPFVGFVAGTKIMTARGPVSIEDLKPGDMIQVQPDDGQGHGKPDAHEDGQADAAARWWERN